jgi:hypothetical protein
MTPEMIQAALDTEAVIQWLREPRRFQSALSIVKHELANVEGGWGDDGQDTNEKECMTQAGESLRTLLQLCPTALPSAMGEVDWYTVAEWVYSKSMGVSK